MAFSRAGYTISRTVKRSFREVKSVRIATTTLLRREHLLVTTGSKCAVIREQRAYNDVWRIPGALFKPQMSSNAKQIRMFVVVLSMLVFLLTLNAKLSLYDQPTPVNTANSSKLWLNGQKMEQPAPILVLAVLSVAYLVSRLRFPRSAWQRVQIEQPVPSRLISFRARRFLRPPPASQSLFIA